MALEVTIKASGKTMSDIEAALEEATRKVLDGFTSGGDRNDTGSYTIDVTGEDEE